LGVSEPVELLDLIYADSGGTGHPGPDGEPVGVWHVPTWPVFVQESGRTAYGLVSVLDRVAVEDEGAKEGRPSKGRV